MSANIASSDRLPTDFVSHLRSLATERPADTALIVVSQRGDERFDYAAIDRRVRAVAAALQSRAKPGDRALLLLDNDPNQVVAFFACLYAGVIAVPVFPPDSARDQHLARLVGIATDCEASLVLTSRELLAGLRTHGGEYVAMPGGTEPLVVDDVDHALAPDWTPHSPRRTDIAFLQYTSGSTSTPKGVMVSHANLMANERAIAERFAVSGDDVFVSWLPLYHDMGLIGGLLQPFHHGIPLVLMSPSFFLERPVRWLEAIARHKGTISGGPDFAWRLCLDRVRPAQVAALDLSSWRIAFSGAEPVRHDTLRAFVDHLAPAKFDPHAVYPCYGLAEATLLVSGGRRGQGMSARAFDAACLATGSATLAASSDSAPAILVACGAPPSGHVLRIVDPMTEVPLAAHAIGEVQFAGPSVAQGYWRRMEASEQTFVERDGRRWLRTGDLGVFHDGELFITGRLKDLIILRGHNLYPQDIERAVEADVDSIRRGRIAAFSVALPDGGEGIGIAAEISRAARRQRSATQFVAALAECVGELFREPLAVAVLLEPGGLPRTSSGKVQRAASRDGWARRTLDAFAIHEHGAFVLGGPEALEVSDSEALDDVESALAALWQDVLGQPVTTRRAHFFAQGGHSLAAARLAALSSERWEVDVAPRLVFEAPRLAGMAAAIRARIAAGRHAAVAPIPSLPAKVRGGWHLLSAAQERQWFLWNLDPESTAYRVAAALRLIGEIDAAALRTGLERVVTRHEALRTVFDADIDGVARQRVIGQAGMAFEHVELPAGSAEAIDLEIERLVTRPFDLRAGPLLRSILIRIGESEHVLALAMHHIIADAASVQVIFDGLAADLAGAEIVAPRLQMIDHAAWQRDALNGEERERQLDYWRTRLGGDAPVLALATDHPRGARPATRAAEHQLMLPRPLVDALRARASAQDATLSMALLAGFHALLHRHTSLSDVRVGVPRAGRDRLEWHRVVGMFVDTQTSCTRIDGRTSLDEVLDQTREAALGAQAHADLPFEQLVEALRPDRSSTRQPFFQVLFNHLIEEATRWTSVPGVAASSLPIRAHTLQFELTLEIREQVDGQCTARFIYASELFEEASINRFAEHYRRLLQAIATSPQSAIGDVELLDDGGRAALDEASLGPALGEESVPVHRLIEAQAVRTPKAVALVFGDVSLTYDELNRRANRLAHRLIRLGVDPDVLVGVACERSVEMVVALLATLKAGGAYVPLDPEYPADRLSYMLEDSGVSLLLSHTPVLGRLPLSAAPLLDLTSLDLDPESDLNPDVLLHDEHLAYVIYTSGSTGRPKGAANRHRALHNRLAWMQHAYPLDSTDAVLQKTPFGFDVSVWEFFWPLMFGAKLVMAGPGDHRDPSRLSELIARHRITTLHFVPAMLQAFMAHGDVERCGSLKRIVCSGEALPAELQNQVLARLPHADLYNLYGPTEAAIDVTHWTCVADGRASVAIGRPISQTQARVLDAELNETPPGVPGELYLGGVGLARGYLNRAPLTSERFVADPFVAGERLYRTGDLARWRADGQLEYLGRTDHQVKIRGLRIELGEIEARLASAPAVREAAVIADQGPGGTRLVAYVAGQDINVDALKAHLSKTLPDYMVPSAILVLEELPLNANGKLDRKALPKHDMSVGRGEAPQGEIERALAAVWREVLGLRAVGRHDNFFELGGDSILSLQIVARARNVGLKLAPRQMFERQTIAALAGVAELADAPFSAQQVPIGDAALLPIQAEFFSRDPQGRHHWNQAVLLQGRQHIDAPVLSMALEALVQHHDALRLRFSQDSQGAWRQAYGEYRPQELLWVRKAADAQHLEALCNEAHASLDISAGPLLRAMLVDMLDGMQRLLITIHHLVVDGVSWRVLLDDLQAACSQIAAGGQVEFPPRTTSLQAWGRHLSESTATHADEIGHWKSLAGVPFALPGEEAPGVAETLSLKIDRETTRALLRDAPPVYRTQVNDLLLTALGRAVTAWTGEENLLIDLEGHGRDHDDAGIDLSCTVGWLTALTPIVLEPNGELGQAILRVKEDLRRVPRMGRGAGVLRHLGTPVQRGEMHAVPRPELVFNYLGQLDATLGAGAAWQLAPESPGRLRDPAAPRWHAIAIDAHVRDGCLHVAFEYGAGRHSESDIDALSRRFDAELRSLVAHCTSSAVPPAASPSDFPLAALTQPALDALPLAWSDVDDLYPLSPMQKGLLFHSLMQPDGTYLTQLRLDLDDLDVERFQQAWGAAIARHATLRTGFLANVDPPLQWVASAVTPPWRIQDLRANAAQSQELDSLAEGEIAEGFELARPPLMRFMLARTGQRRWHFIWTCHHLLLDGWSTARLMAEVMRPERAVAPVASYRDHIAWLLTRDPALARAHWARELAPLAAPTHLAEAWPRPSQVEPGGMHTFELTLPIDETQRLKRMARQERVTINAMFQAAWALLLQRCTGQATVCFGATTAGRPADVQGMDEVLGLFINTLPVVASPPSDERIGPWLRSLQASSLASRAHEHASLADIQRWAPPGAEGLFDTLLVFENYPINAALKSQFATDSPAIARWSHLRFRDDTHYPLTLGVHDDADGLRLVFTHDTERIDEPAAASIARWTRSLLRQLSDDADAVVSTIELLSTDEKRALATQGRNAVRHAIERPVHALIAEQARCTPEAIAVIQDDASLTYAALEAASNRLARDLRELGVAAESRVGLAVERGIDMIVALLAILKAGGAYVPLDPDYPPDRLAHIVDDSGLALIVTQASIRCRLPARDDVRVLCLDAADAPGSRDASPLDVDVHPGQLAYVIYTSGSTGRPKGVGIAHHALVEHAQAGVALFGLTASDRMLQFSTLNFDGFIEQVFPPLCAGAGIVLRGPDLWDSETFHRALLAHRITVADLTTAYWFLLVQDFAARGLRDYGALRQLHAGGEAMPPEGLKAWREAGLSHVTLLNTYGPTEAAVTATALDCASLAEPLPTALPIGTPLDGRQLHVVDPDLRPVPAGIAGELCIAGDLLARGYLGRPGLSAERFVADPFDDRGGRLYRTGDLVRFDADGRLQYLGRLDHQVKVRGFRVELGEIETTLLAQPEVRQALVRAEPGPAGLRLVGYVALDASRDRATATELRERLARSLPDYMVPATLVLLDELPLNANGKVDRNALVAPVPLQDDAAYVAPFGAAEEALAAIWSEVLGIPRVGRDDAFFELGGDSLGAIRITALLAQRHGHTLPVRALFEHPSLRAVAEQLAGAIVDTGEQARREDERRAEIDRLLAAFEE